MIHYVADTHFGHESIIKFCKRPFASVDAMNEAMIKNWNRQIKPGDVVYVVGDFAYRIEPNLLNEIFSNLAGDKHLIRGNHDGKDVENLRWSSVRDHAWVNDGDFRVYLCHYGIREFPNFFRKNTFHLYGHSHARLPGNSRSDDCGVDAQALYMANENGRYISPDDYRPVSLMEMLPRMQQRPAYDPHKHVVFPIDPDFLATLPEGYYDSKRKNDDTE